MKKSAFTMAEILLSLTIIGVVAAITLPSLTGNINERTWNTQRKALYARMTQAIALMPALNGFGTFSGYGTSSAIDTAAETFVASGLSKVLKINNICDNDHLEDCGVVSTFTNMAGSTTNMPKTLYELNTRFSTDNHTNTKAVAFETQNGESIVAFYNPKCNSLRIEEGALGGTYPYPNHNMCVNFIYDLNNAKGPNTVGKDIGVITVFRAMDSEVVAPLPLTYSSIGQATFANASSMCTAKDSDSRLPNIYELSSLFLNETVASISSGLYWASTIDDQLNQYVFMVGYGGISKGQNSVYGAQDVICVKRQ